MENLKHLVRNLTGRYLPVAVKNKSFFVNDISDEVSVEDICQQTVSVINRLLFVVAGQLKNTCIRFSARKHGYLTILEIRESGNINSFALASDLQQVYVLADELGGTLNISIPSAKITTISFSFPA